MKRLIVLSGLLLCHPGGAIAGPPDSWACVTADDAQARKRQVVDAMSPRVAFEGERQPTGVAARMDAHRTPALSVAVIRNGRLDWSAAWGVLERDGARADCGSLFQAGSLSKPATLLAALRMKQRGAVDFDEDIETRLVSYHLPAGAQSAGNPVTLRNLFAHTSGLTPGGYEGYPRDRPLPTLPQILRGEAPANSRKASVATAPGARLAYSGAGYTLIETALQDQLHQPFDALMREWLIAPLGMREASFAQPAAETDRARVARGHAADGSAVPGGWRVHPERAAAGLWATPSDMAALLIELYKGYHGKSALIGQASVRELLANPIEGHAYGFRLIGEGDDVFITHYGGTVGYRAGMTINLRTGDGAVYLGNSDNGSELGVEFLNAVSRAYGWPSFKAVEVKRAMQPIEALRALTGRYDFDQSPSIVVTLEKDALTLVFPNGDRYAMTPIQGAPREFIHPETAVRASFDGDGDATVIHLYGETGKRRIVEAGDKDAH